MVVLPVLVLAATLAQPVAAPCSDQTQSGLNDCAEKGLRQADAALNRSYAAVSGRLRGDGLSRLLHAQRAWLAFRDAQCAFAASGVEGGSAQPMVAAECLEELTRQRTETLDGYLHCPEGDLACPLPR